MFGNARRADNQCPSNGDCAWTRRYCPASFRTSVRTVSLSTLVGACRNRPVGTVAGTARGSDRDPGAPWRLRHGVVYSIIFSLARTKFRLRIASFSSQCTYSRGCSSFVGAVCVVIASSGPREIPRQFRRTLSALHRDGPRPRARLLARATINTASEILARSPTGYQISGFRYHLRRGKESMEKRAIFLP